MEASSEDEPECAAEWRFQRRRPVFPPKLRKRLLLVDVK
jgi:hypothetical protein